MQPRRLPKHVTDILLIVMKQLESAREQVLELLRVHGYELVQPPPMEYSGSLLTHIDEGLSLKTICVVDQISGRQLDIHADITPQATRVDTYPLSTSESINRLCYAGPVLHARPNGLLSTHEPLQVGVKLHSFAGAAADTELIDLMLRSMGIADIGGVLLSLGHIGVFRALARAADLDEVRAARLLPLVQDKGTSAVPEQATAWRLDGMQAKAFALLPAFYGGREILARVRAELSDLNTVSEALDGLEAIYRAFPLQQVHVDLFELYVDEYHTGLLFAAYDNNRREVMTRDGRCDDLGAYSGRSHPTTGFSFDMRTFVGRLPAIGRLLLVAVAHEDMEETREAIGRLRAQGRYVVVGYGVGYNGS